MGSRGSGHRPDPSVCFHPAELAQPWFYPPGHWYDSQPGGDVAERRVDADGSRNYHKSLSAGFPG
jgi:hypothetical protein